MKRILSGLLVVIATIALITTTAEAYTVLKAKYVVNSGWTAIAFHGENHVFVQAFAPVTGKTNWLSIGAGPEFNVMGITVQAPVSANLNFDANGTMKADGWAANVYLNKKFGKKFEVQSQNTVNILSPRSISIDNFGLYRFNQNQTAIGPEIRWKYTSGKTTEKPSLGVFNQNKLGPTTNENYVGLKKGKPIIETSMKIVF